MSGQGLAKVVSIDASHEGHEGVWQLGQGYGTPSSDAYHVVAYDFGVKRNILRLLTDRGCRITVVPAQTPVADVLALKPDGLFLSNGPGDPEPCDYAIETARSAFREKIPLFGICLGQQIMGLALGRSEEHTSELQSLMRISYA